MSNKIFNNELLSRQVKDYLAKQIISGKYSNFDRLPSEDVMAEELGVSRLTVRHALATLAKEGIIIRRRGIGTLINPKVVGLKARLDYHMECTEMLRNHGYDVTISVLDILFQPVSKELANKLKINISDKVCTIKKMWLANETPAIYVEDSIPAYLFKKELTSEISEQPIFSILQKCCDEEFYYDVANVWAESAENINEVAQLLKVKNNASVLVLEQVAYNQDSLPIFHSKEYYRSDLIKFSLVRTRI